MGACCCGDGKLRKLQKMVSKYYKNSVFPKLKDYKFDAVLQDQFSGRVAKENNTNTTVTNAWIKYYIAYMTYVGWLFGYENKRKSSVKPNFELQNYLAIPFEILQVWKCHLLFTDKYKEFCLIVSNGKKEFIPFEPPKKFWKTNDLEKLQKNFNFNKQMVLNLYPTEKKEINSLFIFQSSYLKNRINYNLEEGSDTLINITTKFNEELKKENGVFTITTRNLISLQSLANKIEALVNSAIIPENYPGGEDWVLYNAPDDTTNNFAVVKKPLFENIKFPTNFSDNFCEDHILSKEKGSQYIDNYKKFLFLITVTKQTQTPSEEVDLVWHYHQMFIDEYLKFSKDIMERPILSHMPAIGEKDEGRKFKEQYENTIAYLVRYFGSANPNIWPDSDKRFKQTFKWFNHHTILQRCENYKSLSNKDKNIVVKTNEVYFIPGCYIGCGMFWGAPILGCGAIIGCGVHVGCGGFIPHGADVVHSACSSDGSGCHSGCGSG